MTYWSNCLIAVRHEGMGNTRAYHPRCSEDVASVHIVGHLRTRDRRLSLKQPASGVSGLRPSCPVQLPENYYRTQVKSDCEAITTHSDGDAFTYYLPVLFGCVSVRCRIATLLGINGGKHLKLKLVMIANFLVFTTLVGCRPDSIPEPFTPIAAQIAAANKGERAIGADTTMLVGDSMQLTVGTQPGILWRKNTVVSSSDTSIASVNATGLVLARKAGIVVIKITDDNSSGWLRLLVSSSHAQGDSAGAGDSWTKPDSQLLSIPPLSLEGFLPLFVTPSLPAATVDVSVPPVTGRTIHVMANNAAALQAAINNAIGGDLIILPNGSVFTGNFVLPRHAGAGIVTISSENVGVPSGTRVNPATSGTYATIATPNSMAALETAERASNWRLTGLRITLRSGAPLNYGIIQLGTGREKSVSQFAKNIVLDRVYVSAGTEGQTRRCVALNGETMAVVNSWLADCHSKGFDTQGIGGWNGTGPYLIENNWIEGSGQAIMFGGVDPSIANVTPSDITIRRNYLFKPLSWGRGKWTVKAAFELKHAKRVLYESNTIENHWSDAQSGFAILFQALSDNNSAAWTKVHDITIRNSIVRNSTSGVNILSRVAYGPNSLLPSEPSRRILVRNVLFEDVGIDPFTGGSGRLLQFLGDHEDVTIMQNTFTSSKGTATQLVLLDGQPAKRLLLINNVFSASEYGVFGSGRGEGKAAIDFFMGLGTSIVAGNIFPGRSSALYPANNFFPSTTSLITFVNAAAGDFTIRDTPATPAVFGNARVGVDGVKVRDATRDLSRY